MENNVLTGIENLISNPLDNLSEKRLGLLCNPASVNSNFEHTSKLINALYKNRLKAIFSPQHGYFAAKQDNMIESEHIKDKGFNIPVFSLYSKTRTPTKEMFDLIDVLLVDIQDTGAEYTLLSIQYPIVLKKQHNTIKKLLF